MYKIFYICIIWSFLFSHTADHLIFVKVITQPDAAEGFAIYNPTDSPIALDSIYICDNKDYYKIQTGDLTSHRIHGFTAQFPAITISPGDTFHIVLNENYSESYGQNFVPDLVMFLDHTNSMLESKKEPFSSFGPGSNRINEFAEMIILFSWDGTESSLIQDIDYFLWGDTTFAISKDADWGYQNDTPIENQHPIRAYTHSDIMDSMYVRKNLQEHDEKTSDNGITGHDETSEDFSLGWEIVLQKEIILGCTQRDAANYDPLATVDNKTCTKSFKAIIDGNYDCHDPEKSLDYCKSDRECQIIIQGMMVDYFDVTIYGGPHSVTLEDEKGYRVELSIWEDQWELANDDSLGYFINAPFNRFMMQAEGGIYDYEGDKQVIICEPENVIVLSEINFSGENVINSESLTNNSESLTNISPEPYILLPAYGETLNFSYSFPDNSRVIIRIFDLSGRIVTSLLDKYYEDSYKVEMNEPSSAWDGRDHLGQIVPPGTYIMHIEAMNPVSGETHTDAAPIVIGVKN